MWYGDDADAIHDMGHRAFVGGTDDYFWNAISDLQFAFLLSQGLKPSDVLVDVACGALRGGLRLIPYLDQGHYIGIDKHLELIVYGVASELGIETFRNKRPRFIISERFEFGRMHARPTFGIAQSLFTHLTPVDISRCLNNLKRHVAPGCRLFATFFEVERETQNPDVSHSHGHFEFTRADMEHLGQSAGWAPLYIGAWNHPRGQHIIEFRA